MNKKYTSVVLLTTLLCLYHFFQAVWVEEPEVRSRDSFKTPSSDELILSPTLSVEQLAAIYGIEYSPRLVDEAASVEIKPMIIFLNETQVTVKVVSRLGDDYFVVVDYLQQGEPVRQKMAIGDLLLSYRLIGIDNNSLHFEDKDKRTLSFSIFKKSEQ